MHALTEHSHALLTSHLMSCHTQGAQAPPYVLNADAHVPQARLLKVSLR